MIQNISNLGDAAVYCELGIEVNRSTNLEGIKYINDIKATNTKGINNLNATDNQLLISFDISDTNINESKSII